MKKTIIIIALALVSFGFVSDQPKTLKAELTLQEWQVVLGVIEQSNAPHTQVKAVQELLIKQLKGQVQEEKKP